MKKGRRKEEIDMVVDLLEFSYTLARNLGIHVVFLAEPYDNIEEIDYGFRGQIFDNFDYKKIVDSIKETIKPGTLIHFKDFRYLNYSVFAFPDSMKEEYSYEYCVIGPALFQPLTSADFYQLIDQYHIPHEFYQNIQEFYNQVPLVSSVDMWFAAIYQFCAAFLGKTLKEFHTRQPWADSSFSDYSNYPINTNPKIALELVAERYVAEENFLNAVMKGDAELAVGLYLIFRQYKLMPRAPEPLRNMKNQALATNTLVRKTVQDAAVHPLHIDNLSTQLANQIENASSLQQLDMICLSLVRKYCMLVKNYSRRGHSQLIQFCLDYIDFHYTEALSLSTLAKKYSVTPNYLSSLFKREKNMTLTDYIHHTRIHQALILLNTTCLPIQTIANQCGYQDTNYFTRVFKKLQGITPKDYQKKFHPR